MTTKKAKLTSARPMATDYSHVKLAKRCARSVSFWCDAVLQTAQSAMMPAPFLQ
jgi:hypothetical protein